MPPQAVVLAISYRCEGTEGSARMRLTFDSWPQINVEKEWPEIQKKTPETENEKQIGELYHPLLPQPF